MAGKRGDYRVPGALDEAFQTNCPAVGASSLAAFLRYISDTVIPAAGQS
jgi:hypothetical protein